MITLELGYDVDNNPGPFTIQIEERVHNVS
jgi:hypothetical protein